MPAPRTVLLTGAAGGLGTLLRDLLPGYGHTLRLLDVRPVEGAPDAVTADLADSGALREAVRGVDAIIHLAGISLEAPFEKILKANIEGTYNLYEAAREEGVRRVVFASSNHAVGYTPALGTATRSSRSTPRAARTPSTACPSASARTSPSCTGTGTASRRCPCASAPASPSRPACACCRCG
ncbi:hypothetical protein GCM10020256_60250 [Streptomyces thermocoprophilus]